MKKLLGSVIVATMALSMLTGTAMAGAVKIAVDKKAVAFTDAQPFVDTNSRTLVPLRAIGEAMDVTVDWNEETKTATFTSLYAESEEGLSEDKASYLGKVTVDFVVGSEKAKVTYSYFKVGTTSDSEAVQAVEDEVTMDTAAVVKDGRTYAPVKYLAEAFGYVVTWDAETSTVKIDAEVEETAKDEAKTDETKTDETKTDEAKTDEAKTDETKTDEAKTDETKTDEAKTDETKTDEAKTDETKTDETKKEEAKPAYENVPDNQGAPEYKDFVDKLK
ncbi:MAG: stalk domain-containing protein [Lachnospiraceae bacterium]|nr:stalk domain-containing protein [Lachnospiraceae bacterium]